MDPRILLLQARTPDDPVREEERRSFARRAGVAEDRVVPHDLLGSAPSLRRTRSFDALMIGGSGDFYVSKGNLPHTPQLLDLLRDVVALGHPTFASCFGFQLLIEALGGRIVHDPDAVEVGTFDLELTEAGQRDPLLGTLPQRFPAQCGRKDRAAALPESTVHLAASERCPYHALRIDGKPIWATQFHPELTRSDNVQRFERYMDGYSVCLTADQRSETFERFRDSPHTEGLLPQFLRIVFG